MIFEIGGKERAFSFGLDVLGRIQKDLDIDIVDLGKALENKNLFMIVPHLILRGNERELRKEGKSLDYTLEDVDKWLQEVGIYSEKIIGLWSMFNESVMSYLPTTDEKEDGIKKK